VIIIFMLALVDLIHAAFDNVVAFQLNLLCKRGG
jgi:hypothetical protein